ncbi:RHS repeat-associated core domain-containing protein [Flavobacteriaceae bacterium M23B6Z8]
MKRFSILLGCLLLWTISTHAQTGSDAGSTPATFDVTATGAATYNIPFALPPGIKDIVPPVSLNYSSQAGNGIAGWGWNIGGLSTITRIPSTKYHDGNINPIDFSSTDRYALDGQRLLLDQGTYGAADSEYKTEQYSNLKIKAFGVSRYGANYGLEYFLVFYPDGSRAWYGNGGTSHNRLEWSIYKWQDNQGNYILYSYKNVNNLLRLERIRYGTRNGNTSPNEIWFYYTNRSRPEQNFIGGINFTRKALLSRIEITTGGTLYRKYSMTYETAPTLDYERLQKVVEENSLGETRPPIEFSYQDTPDTFNKVNSLIYLNEDINVETDQMASGDFDGDGRMDFVTSKQNNTGSINVFTRIGANSGVMVSYEAYSSNPDRTATFASTILTADTKLPSWQALTTVTENKNTTTTYSTVKFKQARFFLNNFSDEYVKEWKPTAYVYQNYCGSSQRVAVPKDYIPGDFNGDGLTDVIAVNKSYGTKYCRITSTGGGGGGQPRLQDESSQDSTVVDPKNSNYKGGTGSCSCTTYTVNNGQVNFIDLDRRKTTNFASTVGYLSSTATSAFGDRFYAIDFNGDGKTELLHHKEGRVLIYEITPSKTLNLLYEHSDTYLKRNETLLLGDFNGDGKTDLASPTAAGNTNWRFFLSTGMNFETFTKNIDVDYRRNTVTSSSFNGTSSLQQSLWEYHFIAQDFNGDGKTDILKHTVITSLEDESKSKEYVSIYSNKHNGSHSYVDFERSLNHVEHNFGIRKYGIPVFLDLNKYNGNLEYAYIDKDRIWSYTFGKDHREEMLLRAIHTNGITQTVTYHNLGIKETNDATATYTSTTDQTYPFVNIGLAPSFRVVKKVEETGEGITRNQLFKYRNGISHMEGLGFLGFTLVRKTNVHGTNVPLIWNAVQTDPQLRGAVIHEWSSPQLRITPPDGNTLTDFIARTEYTYTTTMLGNKVFVNIPLQILYHDGLTNTLKTESYSYDHHNNVTQLLTTYNGGLQQVNYTYRHNPSSYDEDYHIGRVTEKIESVTLGGSTMTSTEQFSYSNNILSQRKYKGHQTDWIQEDFSYDNFGNLTQKTISTTGMSARSETFQYDTSGRYLKQTTDVEGLTSSMNYDAYGNLTQSTDPYSRTTSFTYDGWNRLKTTTGYLGNQTFVSYTGTANGGLQKTTNTPDGGRTSETFNAFGWTIETATLSLHQKEIKKQFKYDIQGKVLEESEPYFGHNGASQWNRSTYDLYGRLISYQTANGKIVTTTYNEKTVTVDDGTRTKSTTVDAMGNVISATDPGGTITYTYHPNNELKTASYNQNVVSILIDGWGRKIELNDPSAGKYTYAYNGYGELIQETTPTGVTNYTLSPTGKTLQKKITGNETDMTIDYSYDETTKMITGITGTDAHFGKSYQYTYAYDSYERPVSVIENNDAAVFETRTTFDALGRAESTEYRTLHKATNTQNNVRIRNVYSTEGILHELKDWSSGSSLWKLTDQNHRGQPLEIQLGNGYTKTRQYDAFGLPTQIRDHKPNTTLQALKMTYDFNAQRGILNSRTNHGFSWNEGFTYDSQDRLTQISGSVTLNQQYDAEGRFTNKSNVGGYSYDSAKKYRIAELDLNSEGDTWFQDHSLQQVTYNAFKTPVEVVEQGHGRVSFEYHPMMGRSHAYFGGTQTDKLQRRYRKHYSSVSPVEITTDTQTNTTKITTFIGGDAYTAPIMHIRQVGTGAFNAYHYLHRDYLGSILAITDSSGTIREQRQFGAWGRVDKFVNNNSSTQFGYESSLINRGFTGHEHFFGVNLIHMNGRMYDAILGRFLSPDNYVQDPYNTQSFNRYGYVWNNPLSYNDPSGEFILGAFLVGAIIGGTVAAFQSGANFGSILVGAFIGGISSAVGAGFSNIALGGSFFGATALSATGFTAGFTAGAIGGLTAGFVASSLSAWTQGSNFLRGLRSGIYSGAIVSISGGLMGGLSAGLRANKLGLDFYTGQSLNKRSLRMISATFTLNSPIDATDENLLKATNEWYPDAPLIMTKAYSVENISDYAKELFNINPNIGGITIPMAKGSILTGNSKVFFNASVAFSSPEELYKIIGHELLHVSQISALAGSARDIFTKSFVDMMEFHAYNYRSTPGLSAWTSEAVREMMTNYPKWFNKMSHINYEWTLKALPYSDIFNK